MQTPPPELIAADVRRALAEDLGTGDLSAALIDARNTTRATVVSREPGVLCGAPWFTEVFRALDAKIQLQWQRADGQNLQRDQVICRLRGPARTMLSGERCALNFLQTLSGTASLTRRYVEAAAGLKILDTRKTIPGLRAAQKYAVLCGGGHNHRLGLYDAILIKENHIAAAGSLARAITAAHAGGAPFEVEVEDLDMLREALALGATHLLLDNFTPDQLRQAVALNAKRAILEASGNITLETIGQVTDTAVDCVSVGALTKNVRALDLSMRIDDQSVFTS